MPSWKTNKQTTHVLPMFLRLSEDSQLWEEKQRIAGHHDWVRDVAWSPNVGVPYRTLATCSQVRMRGPSFVQK